ncbi:MAG: class I SAM-dependent methyltransferase [Hymenobacteraceae bacterium]|nr:class I SAM-dependent methyltransferase [Hymenobacteraceae bacterium]
MLDALTWAIEHARVYEAIVPRLADALARSGAAELVDLGSGGGGGIRAVQRGLREALGQPVPVTLTDLYPNQPAFERLAAESGGVIRFRAGAVDATAVPADLPGFRTIFSAFHHFPEPLARHVLASAVATGAGIGVFEGAGKRWWEWPALWLGAPLILLLVTPFLRPFRWSRLALTYLVPLIPLGVLWDGTASLCRLYPPADLRRLAQEADPQNRYEWTCGVQPAGFGRSVTYLVGVPKSKPV